MSLGLNDLKKRPVKVEPSKAEGASWARGKTARPWKTSGLSKGPKGRKSSGETPDAHMNIEWASDHTAALNAFDMEAQTPITQLRDLQLSLKEQAIEFERKIKRAVVSPFQIMRSVLAAVRKSN